MHFAARKLAPAFILGLLVIPGGGAWADTLVLRTGEVLTGKILRATDDEVSIELESGGVLSFRTSRIEKLRRFGPTGYSEQVYTNTEDGSAAGKGRREAVRGGTAGQGGSGQNPPGPEEDLSSFPLHARRAPSAASPAPLSDGRSAAWVRDTAKGYSILPPPGFKPWADPKLPPSLRGFMDPVTQSNLTISTYESDQDLDAIKDGIVGVLPRHSKAKVVHQVRRDVPGPDGYEGWLLSLENTISDTVVHQLQLIAKDRKRVFIVTFSAAGRAFSSFSRAFEESLDSFRVSSDEPPRLTGADPGNPGFDEEEEAPSEPGKEDIDRLPPEVESHLWKKSGKAATGSRRTAAPSPAADPNRLKNQAKAIRDRADDRLRRSPYGAASGTR